MLQLGGAFGLAITTIVFNSTMARGSQHNQDGNTGDPNASSRTQEWAYKSAMWGGFAFGLLGALLAVCFLRGVGPVGHAKSRRAIDDAKEQDASKPQVEKVVQKDTQ